MKLFRVLPLVAVLSLAFVGCSSGSEAAFADMQTRVIAVNTANVELGDIRSELSFAGQVRAEEHIAVIGRMPGGMVDEVLVDVGDFVYAGDVLFSMDAVDIQNNVNSLTAQLVTAEAAVSAARTGVTHAGGSAVQQQILQATGGVAQAEMALAQAEAGIEQATLVLAQAENGYNLARQGYDDTLILFDAGVSTRMQMDQAELGLSNAQIAFEQATNGYNIAQLALTQAQTAHNQAVQSHQLVVNEMPAENIQRAQDGLAQAIAQRDSLEVNLRAAMERLDDAIIRAPISGVIGSRSVEPGVMLMQGAPPFTIVSADTVRVGVEVTEVIINQIQPGQDVTVHISAANELPFVGQVTMVSPAANERTSTFSVEISVDNSDGLIRPGMFAEVFFTRQQAEGVVIVPRAAVLMSDGEHVVYLASGNVASRRVVDIGIDNGVEIEITCGLSTGEPLIVTGQNFVTDGAEIVVVYAGGIQ